MLNIAENLLNISKSLKLDEFDVVKKAFKEIIQGSTGLSLDDSEFLLDKNIFKIRTLGLKKARILLFLSDIQQKMSKNSNLSGFILLL